MEDVLKFLGATDLLEKETKIVHRTDPLPEKKKQEEELSLSEGKLFVAEGDFILFERFPDSILVSFPSNYEREVKLHDIESFLLNVLLIEKIKVLDTERKILNNKLTAFYPNEDMIRSVYEKPGAGSPIPVLE